uniref:Uncharacterized protein n=1 Tax=Glycine max TaxID=3847 RepID=C6TB59_SOYBN|nr:unknown [Glycine max]ACU19064.1 unknown [Glycine max]
MGRVKHATMTAARRRRRMVILRVEDQEKDIINLRRQGLHSSSSSCKSGEACFDEDRALNPTRFARFDFILFLSFSLSS